MKITDDYTFFYKDPIAQWNKKTFKDNKGVEYNCAEQYMMAKKAILFNDLDSYRKIMNTVSPREQQNLGRNVLNFNQEVWNANAQIIVYQGNYFKFTQNKDLYTLLQKTKGTILVEASPIDCIWGVGLSEDDPLILDKSNWKGQNLLGYTLTQLRDII